MSMNSQSSFKVVMYQSELQKMMNWVLESPKQETGGDLFGLWVAEEDTAVIQFVLGRGENSKATEVSFHQDVKFLKSAGEFLTNKHGLCHIGEWHSHHKMNMPDPSQGDVNTIVHNLPNLGWNRFVLIIAHIISPSRRRWQQEPDSVDIGSFLFGRLPPWIEGNIVVVKDGMSPFTQDAEIANRLKGVEAKLLLATVPSRKAGREDGARVRLTPILKGVKAKLTSATISPRKTGREDGIKATEDKQRQLAIPITPEGHF
eukprot:m.307438 g.307438  ORF g.307438 m.307438 type:complete len:259 (+) comp42289_c0_seq1:82-858(+)